MDTTGTTVDISGTITINDPSMTLDANHPFYLIAKGQDSGNGNYTTLVQIVSTEATSLTYIITLIKAALSTTAGEVLIAYDSQASGNLYTLGNGSYYNYYRNMDTTQNPGGVDFTLKPPIELVSPSNGTTSAGLAPVFNWTDYATSHPGSLPPANRIVGLNVTPGTGCANGNFLVYFTSSTKDSGAAGYVTITAGAFSNYNEF